jgi:probable HAF family extracellular repeat protein
LAGLVKDGVVTTLGTLAGPAYPAAASAGRALNDTDDVVGQSDTAVFTRHAFLHSHASGTLTDLGTLHGGDLERSGANDVNDAGQVVGWSGVAPPYGAFASEPFLYANGAMVAVASLVDPNLHWRDAHAVRLTPPR